MSLQTAQKAYFIIKPPSFVCAHALVLFTQSMFDICESSRTFVRSVNCKREQKYSPNLKLNMTVKRLNEI